MADTTTSTLSPAAGKLAWPGRKTAAIWTSAGVSASPILQEIVGVYNELLDTDTAPSLREGAPAPTFAEIGVLATVERVGWDVAGFTEELEGLRLLEVTIEALDQTED